MLAVALSMAACSAHGTNADVKPADERATSKVTPAPSSPASPSVATSADKAQEEALRALASERAASAPSGDVTGPDGFSALIRLRNEVVALYPGTSWPTEQTVKDPGNPVPEHPRFTFEKNSKGEQ
ncbi:hypothetical protein ACFWOT_24530 [Streptomyces sp. NPDC058440]|uniref:hypothetical protein n=1 Tax=Streptomyces sp. NPDC058440 TaxID=3346501 RepID=UPI00365CD1DF